MTKGKWESYHFHEHAKRATGYACVSAGCGGIGSKADRPLHMKNAQIAPVVGVEIFSGAPPK